MAAVYELIKCDDTAIDFLILLLESPNVALRHVAALGLHDLKDNKAVEPLFKAINNPQNFNYNGTLVFALESLSCSNKLVLLFDLLLYGNTEVKVGVNSILDEQEFVFTKKDLLSIKAKWEKLQHQPELCPDYNFWKNTIKDKVTGYLAYLKS